MIISISTRNFFLTLTCCISLSCSLFSSTSDASPETVSDKVVYKNGLEVETFSSNGVVSVIDKQGQYGFALPNYWKAGPITEEFYSDVKEAAAINPFLGIAFGGVLEQSGYHSIFAFDISTDHLTSEKFAILTVSHTLDKECVKLSISEIGDATLNNFLPENPYAKVIETLEGESQFLVPWFYFSAISDASNPDVFIAYSGVVVANTGYACLKLNYLTNNEDIDILSELEFTLNSFATFK